LICRINATTAARSASSSASSAATAWRPDEGLDGLLPRSPDAALVHGFLIANFLRPLVVLEHATVRVTGYRRAAIHFPAYLAMLARTLIERCRALDRTAELEIDLRGIPDDPEACVAIVTQLDQALRAIGAAPSFRLTPELRAALGGRLERIVIA
jgi:hypothetical protein